jgi:addiction module HigA family antidote
VIVGYRDKRTGDFAAGKWVKAFSGFERSARLKLDRLEAATSLRDLTALPGNRFEALHGDRKGASTASASTINGGSVSSGPTARRVRQTSRLWTITRGSTMTITAIHPGEHLAEELETLDMSAAELARKLDVPTNRVTQILNGTRSITGDTALRLAHFFGTSAEFWLNLQTLYDLRLAQQKTGRAIKALPRLKRREPVPV